MHHCDTLVIHCIDFRFHNSIHIFVEQELGSTNYDVLTVAGAAKHLTSVGAPERQAALLEDINISLKLHDPQQIVLVNHADCGSYGGAEAFRSTAAERQTHEAALSGAARLLQSLYPHKKIVTAYAVLEDEQIRVAVMQK